MCQGPIQWLGLHLPCIDSHAVDLAKRDSLFISSAKAKNIKMARWILSLQTCRSCPCPVCVYAPTSARTHTHTPQHTEWNFSVSYTLLEGVEYLRFTYILENPMSSPQGSSVRKLLPISVIWHLRWNMLMAPLYGQCPHKCRGCGLVIKSFLTLGTPWTIARHYNPLSMGFSRQEYWGGLPFLTPGDLPDLGIEPWSPALQVDSLLTEPTRVHIFI